jgi:bacillithiol biosynthesis cysteine-adding enzyme BshC
MTSHSSSGLAIERTPFSALPGFSRLFADYCEHFDRLSPYFEADFRDVASLTPHCERILAFGRDRDLLTRVLLEQNQRWGLDDPTRRNIDRLAEPNSVAVVTGQQVGLLGGPLYTVYKTATALKLAREWSTDRHPVVPVFWLEGEDHDLDEVRSVELLGSRGLFSVDYDAGTPPPDGNHGPVGRLLLGPGITEALDVLDEELPPTEFHDGLIQSLRDAYKPGATMRDAFARVIKSLFPGSGLVFISPDDRQLKNAAVPLFVKEIEESAEVTRRIEKVSSALANDYHAQVRSRPTNLFYIDDKGRSAIDASESGERFTIRHHDSVLDLAELTHMIEADPCAFSTNVILRPLLQDRLLPTVAYVGGPGEVAYFAQFKSVYDWAQQPMPIIYPRASVTIVESRIQKIAKRYELTTADAAADIERLFKQVVLDKMEFDLPSRFAGAAQRIDEAIEEVRSVVTATDATLEKALEATRTGLHNEWSRLQGSVLKAEKRRHEDDRRRLERLQESLYPAGGLQERAISVITYMNKYGPDFVMHITNAISTDTRAHQVITLEA